MPTVETDDADVGRLLKHARRIEQEGKTEIAEVVYSAASDIARLRQERDPTAFVQFVLRHTLPERALMHSVEVVHSLIKHHPFAQAYVPLKAVQDDTK